MTRMPHPVFTLVAAAWALPYLASKIEHALHGRLGVHGGPTVTAGDIDHYGGPAQIAAAQWGNTAVGAAIVLITLLPLLPITRSWNRWVRTAPLVMAGAMVLGMAVLFLVRVLAGDGGTSFTVYLFVWAGLLGLTIRSGLTRQQPRAGAIAQLSD